jgi:hypothetical protein
VQFSRIDVGDHVSPGDLLETLTRSSLRSSPRGSPRRSVQGGDRRKDDPYMYRTSSPEERTAPRDGTSRRSGGASSSFRRKSSGRRKEPRGSREIGAGAGAAWEGASNRGGGGSAVFDPSRASG